MNHSCPFCSINAQPEKAYILYEDELVLAFLDIAPVAKGHCLIIPREHYEDIFSTPEPVLERINRVAKKLALDAQNKLHATGVNILNASGISAEQSVFHLHYHVVPRYDHDELSLWFHKSADHGADVKECYALLKESSAYTT